MKAASPVRSPRVSGSWPLARRARRWRAMHARATSWSSKRACASAEEYTRGFGLSEREFKLVKERLEPGSRSFLVKQGHHSVVCKLDLKGCDAELAVISGRARQLECMRRLIREHGSDPADWLAAFLRACTGE